VSSTDSSAALGICGSLLVALTDLKIISERMLVTCLQTLSIVDSGFGHGGISFRPRKLPRRERCDSKRGLLNGAG